MSEMKLKDLKECIELLCGMHLRLIKYYEEESKLKRSHQAYLYLRDEAEEVCEADKVMIEEILKYLELISSAPDVKNSMVHETVADMEEDLIVMGDLVDVLTTMLARMMVGKKMGQEDLMNILCEVTEVSDGIIDKWDSRSSVGRIPS